MPIYYSYKFDVVCNRCSKSETVVCGKDMSMDRNGVISKFRRLGWKIIHAVEQGDPEIVFCPACASYVGRQDRKVNVF